MAGGDLNVRINAPGMGGAQFRATIDANSTKAGNMTEPVNVDGKTVFMTKEGKDLYEKKMAAGEGIVTPSVQQDPGFFASFFTSLAESAVGNPKAK